MLVFLLSKVLHTILLGDGDQQQLDAEVRQYVESHARIPALLELQEWPEMLAYWMSENKPRFIERSAEFSVNQRSLNVPVFVAELCFGE